MLGIRYLKVAPTTYVLHYSGGRIRHQGAGQSFFYFAPFAEIVLVPLESTDIPFVFNESTADFQEVTIQGELTYRVIDPKKLSEVFNFSVDARGIYRSEDRNKLGDRLVHTAQILARSFAQQKSLKDLLLQSDELIATVLSGLKESAAVNSLGVEILNFTVVALRATPEMSKAFQAEARESLLRRADEAIYARRNASVEMERTIRENELNTEIAVAQKQQQVQEAEMAAKIAVESQRSELLKTQSENDRLESDLKAYAIRVTLEPLKDVDWKVLMAASGGGDSRTNVALAFRELAENASKIGELNISPDLLSNLLRTERGRDGGHGR